MEINFGSKHGRSSEVTSIELNGPVGSMAGIVLSVGSIIVAVIFLVIFGLVIFSQVSKINYKPIKATVVKVVDKDIERYEISYFVNSKGYTEETPLGAEYVVGDEVDIYYNPSNPEKIALDNSVPVVAVIAFIIIFIVLLTRISSLKRNYNNYMSFVKPGEYEYDNSQEASEIGDDMSMLNPDSFDYNKTEDGDYRQIRF